MPLFFNGNLMGARVGLSVPSSGSIVYSAKTWTPYRTTGSVNGQYQVGELVYWNGNVYSCKATNDSIPTSSTTYWTNLGSGNLIIDTSYSSWLTGVRATGADINDANRNSINTFFASLKDGGVFNAIQQSNLLVGPSLLAGALVPLAGNTPVNYNNNFGAADYSPLTGLKGNASNKYLQTGFQNPNSSVTSRHLYVCTTANATAAGTNIYLLSSGNFSGDSRIWQLSSGVGSVSMAIVSGTTTITTPFGATNGWGISRLNSTTVIPYTNSNQSPITNTQTTPTVSNFGVFATGTGVGKTDARIAFYSIGTYADLSVMDACVKTLLSALV